MQIEKQTFPYQRPALSRLFLSLRITKLTRVSFLKKQKSFIFFASCRNSNTKSKTNWLWYSLDILFFSCEYSSSFSSNVYLFEFEFKLNCISLNQQLKQIFPGFQLIYDLLTYSIPINTSLGIRFTIVDNLPVYEFQFKNYSIRLHDYFGEITEGQSCFVLISKMFSKSGRF